MHRFQFLAGALNYGMSVLWMVFLLMGLAVTELGENFPRGALIVWIFCLIMLFLPRLLALVFVVRIRGRQPGYRKQLFISALVAFMVHVISAPIVILGHVTSVLRLFRRSLGEWQPAHRNENPSLMQAVNAVLGRVACAVFFIAVVVFSSRSYDSLLLISVALPLLLAGPIVIFTGDPKVARWVARRIALYVSPTVLSSRVLVRRRQLLSHPRRHANVQRVHGP
jgi:membrane glycosyltransferase